MTFSLVNFLIHAFCQKESVIAFCLFVFSTASVIAESYCVVIVIGDKIP